MDANFLVNAAAALGQVVAGVMALAALIVSLRTARAQMRLSESIAHEQRTLMFEQVRMQRDSDILRWTQECVCVLSACEAFFESYGLTPLSPERRLELHELRHRLSALIDHGRLFFPNSNPDKKGADKPAAYQGFRQRILSHLVSVYGIISKFEGLKSEAHKTERTARLNELRRSFVSEAQLAIDPRRFIALKEMNEIRLQQGLAIQRKEERDPAEADL